VLFSAAGWPLDAKAIVQTYGFLACVGLLESSVVSSPTEHPEEQESDMEGQNKIQKQIV
jgi:hypothetical protein